MSSDILQTEFYCTDCNEIFDSASQLLTHFALHASQNKDNNFFVKNFEEYKKVKNKDISYSNDSSSDDNKSSVGNDESTKKCNVPDLYPIDTVRKDTDSKRKNLESITNELHSQLENRTSQKVVSEITKDKNNGVQNEGDSEEFNPLKYCLVTMDDAKDRSSISSLCISQFKITPETNKLELDISEKSKKPKINVTKKRYPCTLCTKVFGWSTDLKRHVLTHTGERPFKCKMCDSCFTRNFLLQKHEVKAHSMERYWKEKMQMPSLKPIITKANIVRVKESRKQSKQNIQRKKFYDTSKSFEYKEGLQ